MDKKSIPIFRLRFNEKTGQWEQSVEEGFFGLTPETLAELYKQSRADMELLREAYIEQALEKSTMSEARDIIDWVKNK